MARRGVRSAQPAVQLVAPKSLRDAEDRYAALLLDIEQLRAALHDPPLVQLVAAPGYVSRVTLRQKEVELRLLKAWIKEHKRANREGGEWKLLMRSREFLHTAIVDEAFNPPTLEAMQRLIDDIDNTVPEWWRRKRTW